MSTAKENGPPRADALQAAYRRRNRILAEFGRDALQNTELQKLLDQAVLRVSQAVEVGRAKIMRYMSQTADLLVVAGVGWHAGVVGNRRLGTDIASPAGCAFQTAQPVTINDLANAPAFRTPSLLAEHGIVSLCNVPIITDGQIWGVLEVDSQRQRNFDADDEDFLHAFASFLGAAIRRKMMESEAQQLIEANATASSQTDLLMRELQHRMKNNLQTILAMISLQRGKSSNDESRRALDHIANRVTAISLAQDQLSTTQRLRTVSLGAYLRALCAYIQTGRDDILVEAKVEDCEVSIDQAVPAGLIVNEAVTNAIKHAFPEGRAGTIAVTFLCDVLSRTGDLIILDDGIGTNTAPGGGSGLDLMKALAGQLGGTLAQSAPPQGGWQVRINFALRL